MIRSTMIRSKEIRSPGATNARRSNPNKKTFTVYDIPRRISDDDIYKIFKDNKKWILRKISIKKQRRYKSVKISVNWIRSKERSSDEKCLRIDLSYKEEIIVTRWFQGSWKAREIRDYLKNKLFTPILVDVTTENRPRYYDQLFRIYKIIITLYALNQLK
ncbi:hypothetical protein RCL_jg24269.t1 [Rhizophagus clarus]|uniref:Uncharacterized protein n=1 Tax=Rhizophagus clarus TaxID=94130 RepID=A0A8H3M2U3_9GLOM|nr:hypothetical protein RCL_jg24269.t1 [Rhizophagus clarus]